MGYRRWLALFTLIWTGPALADVSIYQDTPRYWVALSAAQATLDMNALSPKPLLAGVRVGGMMDDRFGTELRLARGVRGERHARGGARRDDNLDYLASALLLVNLPVVSDWSVRGYAGLSQTQIRTQVRRCGGCRAESVRNDDTSLSWGVGGYWRPHAELALSLDLMRYVSKDHLTLDAVEVAAVFLF